jgi:hypothetical protein
MVPEIDMFFSSDLETIQAVAKPAKNTLKAATLMFILTNPVTAIQMVKLLQYFEFLRLVNVKKIPSNFMAFLEMFNENVLDIMPNLLEASEEPDQKAETDTESSDGERILASLEDQAVSSENKYCNFHGKF